MRSSRLALVLVIFACLLLQQTHQFSFPKLEFSRLKEELKKAGKRILEKLTFVQWIIDKIKSKTNTKRDVKLMVTNTVDKYWANRNINDFYVDELDRHQQDFTKHLQGQIDQFQDYLIKLYRIDTSDADFIRHIKADPDRFFLNYDAYHLLRGMDIASLEDKNAPKTTDSARQQRNHAKASDYQL